MSVRLQDLNQDYLFFLMLMVSLQCLFEVINYSVHKLKRAEFDNHLQHTVMKKVKTDKYVV